MIRAFSVIPGLESSMKDNSLPSQQLTELVAYSRANIKDKYSIVEEIV